MKIDTDIAASSEPTAQAANFAQRVQVNQTKLRSELKQHYDFIVCGSGSSGSVVARRLAENPDISVLLLEAGGEDDVPGVIEANQWPVNLGSERDWSFLAQPNPRVNGRSVPLSMGRVVGGGSSINVMVWARGHKSHGEVAFNVPGARKVRRILWQTTYLFTGRGTAAGVGRAYRLLLEERWTRSLHSGQHTRSAEFADSFKTFMNCCALAGNSSCFFHITNAS